MADAADWPRGLSAAALATERSRFGEQPALPLREVLVVGGGGYVGSVLCRQLLEAGYRVRVLEAFLYGRDSLVELESAPYFEVIEGDTRDIRLLSEAMRGVGAVVHLGEIVGDPACALDPETTTAVNVTASRAIAEVAKREGVGRFIYPSSCSVYGASEQVVTEVSGLKPVSLYARGKIAVERALLGMRDHSFNPTILRFATVYGASPRPRFDLVVNLLTAKACTDGEMQVDGGDQWRPFVHVADAAAAITLSLGLSRGQVAGRIFNVGSDQQNYTIRQIAELIHERVPESTVLLGTASDPRNYRVSFDRIRRQLGFAPRRTVIDGIEEIRDMLSRDGIDYRHPRYSNIRAFVEGEARWRLARHETAASAVPIPIDVGLEGAHGLPIEILHAG